ncbi:cytoplasmic protein [Escherichia coli]|nr:cytoplasmic protein [Escherichia coli]EFD0481328.1 cytoplasmic protein [Escherichia coli]EFH8694392.1 cytoplasmic protein [Escherichia coli]EFO3029097.1 cytoplasmic protein [Escherichia coli]
MRGPPVKGTSDNKHHPSGRVFSGSCGFFIYTA